MKFLPLSKMKKYLPEILWATEMIFLIWFVLGWEDSMFDRIPIIEPYIYEQIPGRSPSWLAYVSELDFYFVDDDHERFGCQYKPRYIVAFRTPDIYVPVGGLSALEWEDRFSYCVYHEIGHHIDRKNGRISKTDEFQRAVDLSIEMLENLPEGPYHWRFIGDMLAEFPGINGNPKDEYGGGWGGYRELYAELHEINHLIQIPPPLQKYFKDFIPWIWY